MHAIPIQINSSEYDLFILLEPFNIERIQQYDPAEIVCSCLGPRWINLRLSRIRITYMKAEDAPVIARLAETRDIRGLTQYLARGFEFRPDLGDEDVVQYESVLDTGAKRS